MRSATTTTASSTATKTSANTHYARSLSVTSLSDDDGNDDNDNEKGGRKGDAAFRDAESVTSTVGAHNQWIYPPTASLMTATVKASIRTVHERLLSSSARTHAQRWSPTGPQRLRPRWSSYLTFFFRSDSVAKVYHEPVDSEISCHIRLTRSPRLRLLGTGASKKKIEKERRGTKGVE